VDDLPVRPRDEAEAYSIQSAVHRLIARSRYGEVAGYKVGCATPVMQKYLGIRKPCFGALFAGTMYQSGVVLRHGAFFQVGIEGAIAVRLGRDLMAVDGPFDAHKVEDAVKMYLPAIEVVDNRYSDWATIDTPTLIADDFFAAACVLGEPISRHEVKDLASSAGVATVNGTEVGRCKGSDVMGHPLNALAWLANALIGKGDSLKVGDTVLLSGLTQTSWLDAGDMAAFEMEGLGPRVELEIR
jgi:2-oxo-3-hexenedioate decarboxylase/2-keto-4-pentenoate hydratase